MISYWAYILVGDNNTGKTSFQKYVVECLCNKFYKKLPINLMSNIDDPRMPSGVKTLSTMNRSYQEKIGLYLSVNNFFLNSFKEADISILSSHAHGSSIAEIAAMIENLHSRCYNVAVVFFSNGFDKQAEKISLLNWDERLWIENPTTDEKNIQQDQLKLKAKEFSSLLVSRAINQ